VRYHDHRHPGFREASHHVQHLADEFRVERAGGLVEYHYPGAHGKRAGYRHPLLLPAGHLARARSGLVG
jgi:hypothetical protein